MKDYQTLGRKLTYRRLVLKSTWTNETGSSSSCDWQAQQASTILPKDDEKELIDSLIKPGADLKSIVNEFAMKKEASLKEALEEQKIEEKVEEKQL